MTCWTDKERLRSVFDVSFTVFTFFILSVVLHRLFVIITLSLCHKVRDNLWCFVVEKHQVSSVDMQMCRFVTSELYPISHLRHTMSDFLVVEDLVYLSLPLSCAGLYVCPKWQHVSVVRHTFIPTQFCWLCFPPQLNIFYVLPVVCHEFGPWS